MKCGCAGNLNQMAHWHSTFGRQAFADDREWWWDEDLDAIQLSFQNTDWQASLAIAQELAPTSTLDNGIDLDEDNVIRLLGHAAWLGSSPS